MDKRFSFLFLFYVSIFHRFKADEYINNNKNTLLNGKKRKQQQIICKCMLCLLELVLENYKRVPVLLIPMIE